MASALSFSASVDLACPPDKAGASVHASSILALDHSRQACVWFGGSREAHPDTAIYGAIFEGESWGEPKLLTDLGPVAHWNPVLFKDQDALHLFFKTGASPRDWRTYQCPLDPQTLEPLRPPSALCAVTEDGIGPVRSRPIVIGPGIWIAPNSIETKTDWWCRFDRTEDGGSRWIRGEALHVTPQSEASKGPQGIIQPTLWQESDGRLRAFMRSTYGMVFETESQDSGHTWSTPQPTQIPNNNSGLEVLCLRSGLLVMALNPVKGNWVQRFPLTVLVSEDRGTRWQKLADIEQEKGEFSYPSLTETAEGFALSYTWNRKAIRAWRFTKREKRDF